jgi:hypothetical protein
MGISSFANKNSRKGFFFKFDCFGFSLFWYVLVFTYVYPRYGLCLLLQILFVAALDIKTREVPTVSSVNSLLSQYCKAMHFLQIFMCVCGGGVTVRFAPVVQWAKTGPGQQNIKLFLVFFLMWLHFLFVCEWMQNFTKCVWNWSDSKPVPQLFTLTTQCGYGPGYHDLAREWTLYVVGEDAWWAGIGRSLNALSTLKITLAIRNKSANQTAVQHNYLLNKLTSVEATCFGSYQRAILRPYTVSKP